NREHVDAAASQDAEGLGERDVGMTHMFEHVSCDHQVETARRERQCHQILASDPVDDDASVGTRAILGPNVTRKVGEKLPERSEPTGFVDVEPAELRLVNELSQ